MTKHIHKNDQSPRPGEFHLAGDDAVIPFAVEALDIRGRAVQLGTALDTILARHAFPEPVAYLLAEAMVLTALLGSSLKFEGKFIFQTRSDGPVNRLVCDYSTSSASQAALRAYARFDKDRLAQFTEENRLSPEELRGKGILALTIDQGMHMQRYQGVVALDGTSLEESAHNYFEQSEQIPTRVRLAVAKVCTHDKDGKPQQRWRAGGVLVQFLPHSAHQNPADKTGNNTKPNRIADEDHWCEAEALMRTIDNAELTDPQTGAECLLYRLFHEHGVRVFEPQPVIDRCSCSRKKIYDVLSGFSAEELAESIKNGKITVTCEFCSTIHIFDPTEVSIRNKNTTSPH